jgi:two-component system, OmpR family, alkaline phosphatase synthesis response regulator PhoP
MNESILIVEDEEELCLTLGDRLRSEGYSVDFAADGQAGLEKATRLPFHLIILDIMLPLRSGLDVCAELRRSGLLTPILLLTARSQTIDKIAGLKIGADDYVTKPFDTSELMARIEVLLRRVPFRNETEPQRGQNLYRFGSIVMDIQRTKVTQDGKSVDLTEREFRLLHYLAKHPGITLSREELLREVWGHKSGTLTRTVDVHVASLRQKLEPFPKKPELILTVPGAGYRFQA